MTRIIDESTMMQLHSVRKSNKVNSTDLVVDALIRCVNALTSMRVQLINQLIKSTALTSMSRHQLMIVSLSLRHGKRIDPFVLIYRLEMLIPIINQPMLELKIIGAQ